MKVETLLGGSAVLAAIVVALFAPPAQAAGPAGGASAGKNSPLKLEDVPGSTVKRITLTPRAVERLGIETGKVAEQSIVLKQVVGGVVVPIAAGRPPAEQAPGDSAKGVFGGFAAISTGSAFGATAGAALSREYKGGAPTEAVVEIALSRAEWERLDKAQPARLMPLATREAPAKDITAVPSGMDPVEDAKRSMLKAYYIVSDKAHGLAPNKRVRVELPLTGDDGKRKTVPYSAIYYDAKGTPWVYLNPEPTVYQRQEVRVDRIVGDLAVLSEGPAVGTAVVTVGAPLLYGTEVFKK